MGRFSVAALLVLAILSSAAGSSALADNRKRPEVVRARLVGVHEVPAVSSPAGGSFRAVIDEQAGTMTYTLDYAGLESVAQSHLHFGQHHTNGGISVFLCTNLGNAPAGTVVQACPAAPATITGVIMAAHVTGPTGQGIAAGEFAELLAAIRSGAVYVNVHSTLFPTGEIRGQLL